MWMQDQKRNDQLIHGLYYGTMVLSDGNSEHVAHACKKIVFSMKKKYPILTALELIKRLKQVKYQRFLLTCAPISD